MKTVLTAVLALAATLSAERLPAVEFNSNWSVRGKRVITINTVVRVNQIEVSRTANRGFDESDRHTVQTVEAFRRAVADAIPEAKVTWSFSWRALHDQRPNYVAIRKRVVEYHRQYGDEITFIPGAFFAPMYNSRAQTNRDLHDGLKRVSEMVGGGYRPRAVVAGFLAADNLRYLAEQENIHVAQGTIWSQYGIDNGDGDGSISYPYYPSREHACKPAQGTEDFIDCVNLDGWTCDFLSARTFGGNSRTGVGPIETYGRMGLENGLKESLAVVRNHFADHIRHNGFGWIVVNWEISLVKQYKPEVTAMMTTWLKKIREEFPDAIVPLMSEFGEAWRRENPDNSRLDYRFVERGTGLPNIQSDANLEIRWYMNRQFRLATLRDWTTGEPEKVIDLTRYDIPATEPPDPSVKHPRRNWSLVNRINQKQRRPQDKPVPLSALTAEERRLIDGYLRPIDPTAARTAPAPRELTVERLSEACGIDAPEPRFGWKMALQAGETGVVQRAWRLLVSSSRERLDADDGDLWDSGPVAAFERHEAVYAGKPLASSRRYWWKVCTWDNRARLSAWSAPASFVTGILPADGWKASWIGPAPETRPDAEMDGARWVTVAPNAKGEVVLVRTFDFAGVKPGEAVELRHAASAEHEIRINGVLCHRHSGQVDRWDRLRMRDVTPWLTRGKNTMTVFVKPGARGVPRAFIGAIRFPDGRRLVTDASWGTDLGGVRDTPYGRALHLREEIASPAFEKTFTVARPLAAAILHITGVGFYEASLNGVKIGDKVLDPSPTAYDKRVLYSTYDLSGALRPGTNTLNVLVGHGWYDVRSIATWNFDVAPWRDFPRLIAQLEMAYADGSRETVVSDGSWRQVKSPVGYDCIREGEVIGRHHPKSPDFAARKILAQEVPAPKGKLVAQNCPGAKIVRTLAPRSIRTFPDGTYVVEFPENFAGWIRMTVRGQRKGDVLVIRYDERVNADFSPAQPTSWNGLDTFKPGPGRQPRRIDCHFRYTASQAVCPVGAEFQADRFVSSGAAAERYEPRFTYNGFQYVVLKGLRTAPRADDIVGCVVQTDFPAIGSFACSDETFNTLMTMGDRAYRANFVNGYPTDCPHREKNGWTGDASIASELAQYGYENTAAYEKWLIDILDSQLPSGEICGIVPTSGWGYRWGNGPAWDSALPVVAWNLWCYRRDRRILDVVYPALKRYVDFTSRKARRHLVRHGIGDWNHVNVKHVPAVEFTSSCYYRQAAAILSRLAAVKGLTAEAARYARLADDIRRAIHARYYRGRGVYANARQTAQAMALTFGIVPENERAAVEEKLVASVTGTGCHVDLGLLGSKHVFRALSRMGRSDLAFRMLTNPTSPSPVDWIRKGGTTLWEDWRDGSSRNHIMYGDFMAWAYQYLAGIRLPETPDSAAAFPDVTDVGFRKVVIAPDIIDSLTWVKASVNGPQGVISSSWRRDGARVTLDVTVPPDTTAFVRLPGQAERTVGAGTYRFTCTLNGARTAASGR
jgi:alpha-L-rhamnosidase